jgi:hypothetical protein
MRFNATGIVCTDTHFQFCRAQEAIGFRDGPFAMDPLRLNRIQPWAFHRHPVGDKTHAALTCFHLLMVETDPRADRLTCLPRGVIPDAQQGGDAVRRQAVAAPGQKVGRHGADGAPRHTPEPQLLGLRQQPADQQPITGQGVRSEIALGTRQFLEPGDRLRLLPTRLRGLRQATPPDVIGKAEGPRGMCRGEPDQAVAPCLFLKGGRIGAGDPGFGPLPAYPSAPERQANRLATDLARRQALGITDLRSQRERPDTGRPAIQARALVQQGTQTRPPLRVEDGLGPVRPG